MVDDKIWSYGICNTFALLLRYSDSDEVVEYKWSNECDDSWKVGEIKYELCEDGDEYEPCIDISEALYFLHDFC